MVAEFELSFEQEVAAVDVTAARHGARQIQRQVGLHRLLQLIVLRVLWERSGQVRSGQVTGNERSGHVRSQGRRGHVRSDQVTGKGRTGHRKREVKSGQAVLDVVRCCAR